VARRRCPGPPRHACPGWGRPSTMTPAGRPRRRPAGRPSPPLPPCASGGGDPPFRSFCCVCLSFSYCEGREPLPHLTGRRVRQGRSIPEKDRRKPLPTPRSRHPIVRCGGVLLDVDLGDLDSLPRELALEPPAKAAPRRAVHRYAL